MLLFLCIRWPNYIKRNNENAIKTTFYGFVMAAVAYKPGLSPFLFGAHEKRFLWCFLHTLATMMIVWKMVSNWVAPATFVDRKVIFYGVGLRVNWTGWGVLGFAYWKRRSLRFIFSNKNHQSFMQKFFRAAAAAAAACGHRYSAKDFLSPNPRVEKFVTCKAPKSRQCCLKHLSCVLWMGSGGWGVVVKRVFQDPPAGGKSKTN